MTPTAEAVVAGAGIAGAAAAYFLAVEHGLSDICIVERDEPLSLTSDKSTECYRNWWLGPGTAMVDFANRSIDLIERLTEHSGDRFNLSRRGYLFLTAEETTAKLFEQQGKAAQTLGVGPLRRHESAAHHCYVPHQASGWEDMPTGSDLLLDPVLIQQHFPGISPSAIAALHVRRCGWLRAQQLGDYFLEQARARGARLIRAKVSGIDTRGGGVRAVRIDEPGGTSQTIHTPRVILAPGPYLPEMLEQLKVDLPVACECHVKIALKDSKGALPADAPLLLWSDPVQLPWTDEEKTLLAADAATQYLLETFPAGVHTRPEGSAGNHYALAIWTYHTPLLAPRFPLQWDPHLPEIIVRGLSAMLPAMSAYFAPLPKMTVDGGYYVKTPENRPLIGPLPIEGVFVNAAYSGFGIMTACAGGELLAAHVTQSPLPHYSDALAPARFDDPAYLEGCADAAAASGQM